MNQQNQISFFVAEQKQSKAPSNMLTLKKIEHFSYFLNDQIGIGFSSKVYKGRNDQTNQTVAVKVIDLKGVQQMQFLTDQVTALQKIKKVNPLNLLKLQGVFKTKNNLYIVTQFCQGKDLGKIIRNKKYFSEQQAQSIMKQLLSGYKELYELGIVHRDLKLANLFIKNGILKIADFGFAIQVDACNHKSEFNVGSPTYMSPEALKYNTYSYKSDVWAIGVIAYELVHGMAPWKDRNDAVLYEMIHNNPIENLINPQINLSQPYKNFIKKCLTLNIEERASPQFIINYQWYLTLDFIEGMDKLDTLKYGSLMKIPQSGATIREIKSYNSIDPDRSNQLKKNPLRQPAQIINHKNITNAYKAILDSRSPQNNNMDLKNIINKALISENTPESQVQEEQPQLCNPQNCLLSQLHYCRFASLIYDQVCANESGLSNANQLKHQLSETILRKIGQLGQLCQTQDNILSIPNFKKYIKKKSWLKLKGVIIQYRSKYQKKFNKKSSHQLQIQQHPQIVTSIKLLKKNLTKYLRLIQLLVNYYQVQQLDKKLKIENFAQASKIQYLVTRKVIQNISSDRLINRIKCLGL